MTDADEPRAYTEQEVLQQLFDTISFCFRLWRDMKVEQLLEHQPEVSEVQARMQGFLTGLLSILDGVSSMPGFDLVVRTAPGDAEFHRAEGDNWWPDGAVINERLYMHESFPWEDVGRKKGTAK
jgi:hypothetical protein